MRGNDYYFFILIIFLTIFNNGCNETNEYVENIRNNSNLKSETIKFGENNRTKELVFNFEKIEKSNKKRQWVQIELKSKFKIGSIDNELLLTPSRVMTDMNENIYILDNIDCSVKKFNKMGFFIEKYGRKGYGPGEFEMAWNFDVNEEGNVVISSPNNNKFAVFKENSISEFKPIDGAIDICFTSSDEVLIFQLVDIFNKAPIQKINYKNNLITPYQHILQSKENIGMLPFLTGHIHRYQENKIIYVSEILGYVVIYNGEGKIENVFKLIDDIVHSSLIKKEMKMPGMVFPREEEYLFDASNIFGDNLYILQNSDKENSYKYAVDVYSLSGASYMYSFLLKEIGEFISVYFSKRLYVTMENTEVEVFDYKIIEGN